MLDECQTQLLLDSVRGRISKNQLRLEWPGGGLENPVAVVQLELRAALVERDSEAVDLVMLLAFHTGLHDEYVPVLCELLGADWHIWHEQVALALQRLASPASVEVLAATVTRRFEYLDYENDYNALAVKCLWALGDIALLGDTPAEEALRSLAEGSLGDDPEQTILKALTTQLTRLSPSARAENLAALHKRRESDSRD